MGKQNIDVFYTPLNDPVREAHMFYECLCVWMKDIEDFAARQLIKCLQTIVSVVCVCVCTYDITGTYTEIGWHNIIGHLM